MVKDPDPGSGAFLTPGSGMGKNPDPGSRMNNPDHLSESLETSVADPDPGSGAFLTPGSGIGFFRIPDL